MGDPRRFDLLAGFVARNFRTHARIADIAGGKGYLQTSLRQRGFKEVHTFDKRRGRKHREGRFHFSYRYFNGNINHDFDLLVGMHPDEATDVIIVEAAKRRIPFILCPCCIKPSSVAYWGDHNFHDWVKHLHRLAADRSYEVIETFLPMNGRNLVMYGRPHG